MENGKSKPLTTEWEYHHHIKLGWKINNIDVSEKRRGPRMEPWGTPEKTRRWEEENPSIEDYLLSARW